MLAIEVIFIIFSPFIMDSGFGGYHALFRAAATISLLISQSGMLSSSRCSPDHLYSQHGAGRIIDQKPECLNPGVNYMQAVLQSPDTTLF
jgi:hypothetical protein